MCAMPNLAIIIIIILNLFSPIIYLVVVFW